MKLYTRRDMARLASIGVAGIATGGLAVEFPSSVSSRRRNLVGLKCQNWRAGGGSTPAYDKLEWVSTDEHSWFSLPIQYDPGHTIDIEMRIAFESRSIWGYNCGCGWDAGGAIYAVSAGSLGNGANQVSATVTEALTHRVVINSGTASTTDYYIGGNRWSGRGHGSLASYAGDINYPVGAVCSRSIKTGYTRIKIYSVSCQVDGVVIFRGVPAVAGSSVGLWDEVCGNMIMNSGTGSVTPGPRI